MLDAAARTSAAVDKEALFTATNGPDVPGTFGALSRAVVDSGVLHAASLLPVRLAPNSTNQRQELVNSSIPTNTFSLATL
jgi:hypothetical protein